jgi:hypothetical protein
MSDAELIRRYNYDSFVRANWQPWMQFDASPPLGVAAPDFPLWPLAGGATTLSAVWSAHAYTIVEFGSFT